MKKLVTFVMILSLGLFTVVGCSKPPAKTTPKTPPAKTATEEKEPEELKPMTEAEKAATGEKKPEAAKAPEGEKAPAEKAPEAK